MTDTICVSPSSHAAHAREGCEQDIECVHFKQFSIISLADVLHKIKAKSSKSILNFQFLPFTQSEVRLFLAGQTHNAVSRGAFSRSTSQVTEEKKS